MNLFENEEEDFIRMYSNLVIKFHHKTFRNISKIFLFLTLKMKRKTSRCIKTKIYELITVKGY